MRQIKQFKLHFDSGLQPDRGSFEEQCEILWVSKLNQPSELTWRLPAPVAAKMWPLQAQHVPSQLGLDLEFKLPQAKAGAASVEKNSFTGRLSHLRQWTGANAPLLEYGFEDDLACLDSEWLDMEFHRQPLPDVIKALIHAQNRMTPSATWSFEFIGEAVTIPSCAVTQGETVLAFLQRLCASVGAVFRVHGKAPSAPQLIVELLDFSKPRQPELLKTADQADQAAQLSVEFKNFYDAIEWRRPGGEISTVTASAVDALGPANRACQALRERSGTRRVVKRSNLQADFHDEASKLCGKQLLAYQVGTVKMEWITSRWHGLGDWVQYDPPGCGWAFGGEQRLNFIICDRVSTFNASQHEWMHQYTACAC